MLRKSSIAGIFAAMVLAGLGAAIAAQAATISFDTGPAGAGGSISWAGGDAVLIGQDIPISVVTGIDTPIPQSPELVGEGFLTFTTGPHIEFDPFLDVHLFSGGGSLTITGSIPTAGILQPVTLLSGSFSSAEIGPFGFVNLLIADGEDFKYSPLLSHYGLSGGVVYSFSLTALSTGSPVSEDPFDLTVFSTNVVNTEIPEPSTLTLFATIILFAARRQARGRIRRHIATG
jgi:hypothetical protein